MRLFLFIVAVGCAQSVPAQVPTSDTARRVAVVTGIVHDSISRLPLAGAIVQLVAADTAARFGKTGGADSLGRFTFGGVPRGRYMLGFFHPLLDSLGVEAPIREVTIDGPGLVHADLAIPSPTRLRAAFCGTALTAGSGAVVGVVHDAKNGAPAAGVTVTGQWLEYSFSKQGIVSTSPRITAVTGEKGWFVMCDVPSPGTMSLIASRGVDSTDRIEVEVPEDGFARQALYLSSAPVLVVMDTVKRAGAPAGVARVRTGDGYISGRVVTALDGQPLTFAQVGIAGGPQTQTNERGEWSIANAPPGTRMLEVRALGYYPARRRVDVVAGAVPTRIALNTLRSVLDTIKVTANRLFDDPNGFEARRRSGFGRFLTTQDIQRRGAMLVSDLFTQIPGVQLDRAGGDQEKRFSMRGSFGSCEPYIYLDGVSLTTRNLEYTPADSSVTPRAVNTITATDLDAWAKPDEVIGIEVYAGDAVPVQFHSGMGSCGSILVWTKQGLSLKRNQR